MLIGRSEAMKTVFNRIAKIAPQNTTVLILGESGTGKEVVAKEIHQRSPVAAGPFIAVNCGGVSGELIESELYGHERGAFTGAAQAHDGLFHAAQGGTLFLDEIGAMPLAQQASLLRALEKKEIRRVGGTRTFQVDLRVIAATNNDLDQAMEAGLFRQDLFYRLSRMIIHLPSLRERVDDIPVLSSHFIRRYCKEHARPLRKLSYEALDILCNRTWRGNVRELENVIEQAVFFSRRELIKPTDLPIPRSETVRAQLKTLDEVMREHIASVLAHTAGNKRKAAAILGIARPTLYHRMKRLGLEGAPGDPGPRRRKKSRR
jgi:two-component system response regulator HydG